MEMNNQLMEVAFRIKEMREVCGFSEEEMIEFFCRRCESVEFMEERIG